jgi:hypothetical protein
MAWIEIAHLPGAPAAPPAVNAAWILALMAEYCARPEILPGFHNWMEQEKAVTPDDHPPAAALMYLGRGLAIGGQARLAEMS